MQHTCFKKWFDASPGGFYLLSTRRYDDDDDRDDDNLFICISNNKNVKKYFGMENVTRFH